MANTNYESFLSIDDLESFKIDNEIVELVQIETYNEHILKESILKIGKDICCAIAIQLAIIGYGNKSFGKVKYNNEEIDINDFFRKNKIRSDLTINSKLKPNDLTPRRLIRFFRYSIKDYLEQETNCQSYLFKKYCINKDELGRTTIYPGFEHLADPIINTNNVKKLIETYDYLDTRLGTHIKERIIRVLIARGFSKNSLLINNDVNLV